MEGEELAELMGRYQQGDTQAFNRLFGLLSGRVYGYLCRYTRDPVSADDLFQEVFQRIHKARATYWPGAPVLPWIFAIARNVAAGHARTARVCAQREILEPDFSGVASPEAPERGGPWSEAVRRAVDELPDSQREVITMLKVAGLSMKEIAAATGSSVGAVKLRAHRAYVALRKSLAPMEAAHRGSSTPRAMEHAG